MPERNDAILFHARPAPHAIVALDVFLSLTTSSKKRSANLIKRLNSPLDVSGIKLSPFNQVRDATSPVLLVDPYPYSRFRLAKLK